jgi:hypothetical protein
MFTEMIIPLNRTSGTERDVMALNIVAAGMHHAQKIANSKLY